MTKSEKLLWKKLRNKQVGGYRFRRQFSIGRYVADFYCPELRLVVEIDGLQHNTKENKKYDKERDLFIKSLGIGVIMISNEQILKDINKATKTILTKFLG